MMRVVSRWDSIKEVPLKGLGESQLERLVRGWRREAGSWIQKRGEAYWKERRNKTQSDGRRYLDGCVEGRQSFIEVFLGVDCDSLSLFSLHFRHRLVFFHYFTHLWIFIKHHESINESNSQCLWSYDRKALYKYVYYYYYYY